MRRAAFQYVSCVFGRPQRGLLSSFAASARRGAASGAQLAHVAQQCHRMSSSMPQHFSTVSSGAPTKPTHSKASTSVAGDTSSAQGDSGGAEAAKATAATSSAPKKVFVGISGGVDSSVAALLLKRQGYDVVGVHMTNWDPSDEVGEQVCTNTEDRKYAKEVCEQIGIPLIEENFVQAYWNEVFEPLLEAYSRGVTPNPDTACNSQIKFGHFLERCKARGADFIATGHYASVRQTDPADDSTIELLCGTDATKDQAYFLCRVPGAALKQALFPLATLSKREVRTIAKENGLCTADKKDSYGICFVGKRKFPEFLSQYIDLQPGDFVDPSGKVLGEHGGVQLFTNGQGARISGAKQRLFVAGKDPEKRQITAVEENHPLLFASDIKVDRDSFSWVASKEPGEGDDWHMPAFCRVRHQSDLVECEVSASTAADEGSSGFLKVHLKQPTRGVAEGQVLALHLHDDPRVCLGGGVIRDAKRAGQWSN